MAISEKSRSALYQALSPIAGEEPVSEMLSYFPARDVEEPVTKEFLRAELAVIRTEMGDLRSELRTEMADLRTEMAELRTELHSSINRLLLWLMGTIVATAGVAVGVTVALVR